ncbi:hypothetical protein BN946_scf184791.g16 [Trametes cinnabarina]|uniref:Uncharacterized protein n=1 Tax=Pycnoporus cinnabarinus TaxID=5643 RepID=A0A060S5H0_PYCCI|nr:hypothetical protein BN946_scf184791.g16 [Trametes cinnabarina]
MSNNSPIYARWEIFASVVGVAAVIQSVIYPLVSSQLPSSKLKRLCETLGQTQGFLEDCVEEGVLRENHIQAFQRRLTILRNRTNEVSARVHAARTWSEELANLARGVTSKINCIIMKCGIIYRQLVLASGRNAQERMARLALSKGIVSPLKPA